MFTNFNLRLNAVMFGGEGKSPSPLLSTGGNGSFWGNWKVLWMKKCVKNSDKEVVVGVYFENRILLVNDGVLRSILFWDFKKQKQKTLCLYRKIF